MRLNATFTQSTGKFPASFGQIKEMKDGYSQAEVDKLVADGIEQGRKAEYDRFWDVYQYENTKRCNVRGVFSGARFNATNFFPKYDIVPVGIATHIFYAWEADSNPAHTILDLKQRLTDCGVVLDTSKATDISNLFGYSPFIDNIPTIDCTGLNTASGNVFVAASNLTKIEKLIVTESVTYSNWFKSCRSLVEIRFEGVIGKNISLSDSSKLSAQSVQSIIDCLKDLTGGTAQTLALHATVGNKLTEAQKAAITAKNWTLVY